ncbi:MAG: MBL fold metallo-hydrolase [Oscillospiraceae bacterium]|nr:MBL fold metallo-hydrolase [Oscillospiraceae bacterium]
MIIAPLCSSSKANATFVGSRSAGILIDIGCSYKALRENLAICEIPLSAIKAILLTHEHSDHVGGLRVFSKNHDVPIYASFGTGRMVCGKGLVSNSDNLFGIDRLKDIPLDFEISAFDTPHDAAGSNGYIIKRDSSKIAYMTDLGEITPGVKEATLGSNFVFIESNYEPEMLKLNVDYPLKTKERIRSKLGHLSNIDSADYIAKLVKNGATRIVLGHLSENNNTPQLAFSRVVHRLTHDGMRLNYDYTLDVAGVRTNGECIAV